MICVGTHIGLLRAVNLPGHNKVGMKELCGLLAELGLQDGRSLLQSGNLVFRVARGRTSAHLELALEDAARARLGLQTDFFVRTAADWKAMMAGNPFPDEARRDPSHLLVMFLKSAPDRDRVAALKRAITGREMVRINGRHALLHFSRRDRTLASDEQSHRAESRDAWHRTQLEHGAQTGRARDHPRHNLRMPCKSGRPGRIVDHAKSSGPQGASRSLHPGGLE